MSFVRKALLGVVLSLLLPACDGCRRGPSDAPTRYIGKDAEGVFELKELSLLVRAREAIPRLAQDLLPKEQLLPLIEQATLTLGFDPTTPEGLAAAGLPKQGSVAAEVVNGGRGALWIVPVADDAKFKVVLEKVVRARIAVDEVAASKVGTLPITKFLTSFGDEKVTVAAYAFKGGYALIGAGRTAEDLIAKAAALKPEDTILANSEYQAQVKALGNEYELRFVSPSGGKALAASLNTAARTFAGGAPLPAAQLDTLMSAGWVLAFEGRSAKLVGRLRLNDAALAETRKLFGAGGEGQVRSVDLSGTVAYAEASVDPAALLTILAPSGSPARAEFDAFAERARAELQADVEKEFFPLLTGRIAVAAGLNGVEGLSANAVLQNPLRLVWSAIALGVKDPAAAMAFERRLEPGLAARGLKVGTRKVKETEIKVVGPQPNEGTEQLVLVETYTIPKTMVFSNEPKVTERVLGEAPKPSALDGKGGLFMELRFPTLHQALARLDFGGIPLLARSIVSKAMQVLKALDVASMKLTQVEDGILLEAKLGLVAPQAAQ